MSPALAFQNSLKDATSSTSHAKSTISVTEAKKALALLEAHPHATAADRAEVVSTFLNGTGAGTLSEKAKAALADFVKAQTEPSGVGGGGLRADELKAQARLGARSAESALIAARGRIDTLLQQGSRVKKSDLKDVGTALDGAAAAAVAARHSLTGVLKIADHAASQADAQLKDAGAELKKAQKDLEKLQNTKGAVTKGAVQDVLGWLSDPIDELRQAQVELGGGAIVTTKKYPSDSEDGAFNGGGMGGGFPGPAPTGPTGPAQPDVNTNPQPMVTRKFPSDHEDGGGNAGGGAPIGTVTMKYPSDNEDGGPGGGGGGGMVTTMKAPSDHEDGGPGPAPTDGTGGGPTIKPARTDAMRQVFKEAEGKGNVQWHNSIPLGSRFETAFLSRERHVDGFQFDALIPTGALTPTALQKDPNTVDSFWVRRTGGIAGLTHYAGPFTLNATTI
jgi:hypothetical protein